MGGLEVGKFGHLGDHAAQLLRPFEHPRARVVRIHAIAALKRWSAGCAEVLSPRLKLDEYNVCAGQTRPADRTPDGGRVHRRRRRRSSVWQGLQKALAPGKIMVNRRLAPSPLGPEEISRQVGLPVPDLEK